MRNVRGRKILTMCTSDAYINIFLTSFEIGAECFHLIYIPYFPKLLSRHGNTKARETLANADVKKKIKRLVPAAAAATCFKPKPPWRIPTITGIML